MKYTEEDMKVGSRIKAAMKARRVTVQAFAEKMQCSERSIYLYLQKGVKTTYLLTKVADYLGISIDWLLGRKGPFDNPPAPKGV